VDAGSVTNVATASGTDPDGDPVTSPEDSETVTWKPAVRPTPVPAIGVIGTAALGGGLALLGLLGFRRRVRVEGGRS
jgi:hypothetical protein